MTAGSAKFKTTCSLGLGTPREEFVEAEVYIHFFWNVCQSNTFGEAFGSFLHLSTAYFYLFASALKRQTWARGAALSAVLKCSQDLRQLLDVYQRDGQDVITAGAFMDRLPAIILDLFSDFLFPSGSLSVALSSVNGLIRKIRISSVNSISSHLMSPRTTDGFYLGVEIISNIVYD